MVASCGYPISLSVIRRGMASSQLMNAAPISASAAEEATCLMICVGLRMAPLCICPLLGRLPKYKCPPDLLLAPGSLLYPASLCMYKTISEALYCNFAFGYVAQ